MFYQNFINLCAQKNVSKAAVARAIGISSAAISKWKGSGIPTEITLAKLADYFSVTSDYLLTGQQDEQNHTHAKTPEEIGYDDFTYAMHNEGRRLTKKQKEALLGMARLLAADIQREKEEELQKNGGGL